MIDAVRHRLGVLYLAIFERLSANSWRPLPRPPQGTAVTHGPGHDPDRVLVAGRASAIGWGVLSHDLGLAGNVARATSALTGRGTDVEVVAERSMTAAGVRRLLTPQAISRYDAIVLTLGTREAFELMPVATWVDQLTSVLDHITAGREVSPAIVVVGAEEVPPVPLPPFIANLGIARARELNAASRKLIATRSRVAYVDSALVTVQPSMRRLLDADFIEVYRRCGAAIAPVLTELLDDSPARLRHPVNEEARWKAVAYLHAHTEHDDQRIANLLTTLANLLMVRSADLFFVDRDNVRTLAATTERVPSQPRGKTLSSEALEYRGGLVIPDLTADPRMRDRPDVVGPPFLRFYAGHPVESPDGHRVAVLAVVDTEPRELSSAELAVLREYAIRVGDVLFENY